MSARGRSTARPSGAQPELWTRLAWVPLLSVFACAVYLGSRTGGIGPVVVYQWAPFSIAGVSLVALAAALIASALRRPFMRPGRIVAFAALATASVAASIPFAYPTSHAGRASSVVFTLPFEGEWTVRCGGEGWRENALAFQPARCRGFDFVRVDDDSGSSDRVLAPAAGRIVRAHDGEPDLALVEPWPGGEPYGNHLVLEVAPGEFLFLTHLRAGSLAVSEGERVALGRELGRAGSSGAPISGGAGGSHLGIHLQDAVHGRAEGVPFAFSHYQVDGREVLRGVPRGGVGRDGGLTGERVRAVAVPSASASGDDTSSRREGSD